MVSCGYCPAEACKFIAFFRAQGAELTLDGGPAAKTRARQQPGNGSREFRRPNRPSDHHNSVAGLDPRGWLMLQQYRSGFELRRSDLVIMATGVLLVALVALTF
jgi:hypothetical protein